MTRLATLIVNPTAGRGHLFAATLPALQATLKAHGYTPQVLYTTPELHSGRDLARQNLHSALILACGGDGTVNDILQAVALTAVPLGVLPLGTANALARNLQLPLNPLVALTRLLAYQPHLIPLGELSNAHSSRFFTVLAGCGPSGALVHTLPARLKQSLGRAAYYAQAARLFATRLWPSFQVEYRQPGSPTWHTNQAVALLASRVADLGGLFSGLTPRASLHHPHLHVHLLRAPAHLALPAWFAFRHRSPWLTTLNITELRCTPLTPELIDAQADAEPAGTLPLTLRIVPAALNLLSPKRHV